MEYVENTYRLNQMDFTKEQIESLLSLHIINRIDDHLKIVSGIDIINNGADLPPRVILLLEIFYNSNRVDTLSFDLHNYEYDEIIYLIKNIRDNEFLLQEVDNLLGGDIVE